jgi:uncharacterized damage-inducible protein DinB
VLAPAVVCLVLAPAPAAAQAQSAVMADLLADIREARGKLVGLAKAMPDAAWDWRPSKGARSTKEVFAHIAADNYFIPTGAELAAPPDTGITAEYKTAVTFEQMARTKAQLLAELEKSFTFLEQQMAAVPEASLQTPSKWPKTSKQKLWIVAATHLHEHLGQLIAYARANDVTPPWSKQE